MNFRSYLTEAQTIHRKQLNALRYNASLMQIYTILYAKYAHLTTVEDREVFSLAHVASDKKLSNILDKLVFNDGTLHHLWQVACKESQVQSFPWAWAIRMLKKLKFLSNGAEDYSKKENWDFLYGFKKEPTADLRGDIFTDFL
jgi:hypothetical protein